MDEADSGTIVFICPVEIDWSNDYRFSFDAARWARLAEARGVPPENIRICGRVFVKQSAQSLDTIIDAGYNFCLPVEEYNRVFTQYYKKGTNDLLNFVKSGEAQKYKRMTVILLNHGARDGDFGHEDHQISRKVLADSLATVTIPTLVVSCSCFAAKLFLDLANTPNRNIVRMYDSGPNSTFTYNWGFEIHGKLTPVGTQLSYWILDAFYKARDSQELYKNFVLLKDTSRGQNCKIIIEGDITLLKNEPFLGTKSIVGRLTQPLPDQISNITTFYQLDQSGLISRPGMHPRLIAIIDKWTEDGVVQSDFWDQCYVSQTMDKAISQFGDIKILEFADKLRSLGVLDGLHPAALLPDLVLLCDLQDKLIAELSTPLNS